MSEVYIDEELGNDELGTGTQNAPYKTLAYAIYKNDGLQVELRTRKDAETPYDKPTDSSLKKAKKGADGLKKKAARAVEIAEREAKERAEADKRLEESKKIVLVEDEALPKPTKVRCLIASRPLSRHLGFDRRKSTNCFLCDLSVFV